MWAQPIKARQRAPADSAVCVILRAETREGEDGAFEALLKDLAFDIEADEPACSAYVVTRAMGSPTHFAVHARFKDWQAFLDHSETPHFNRALPRLTPLLASPVSLEIFFEV
jgi:quinol monooxygenase YgiN